MKQYISCENHYFRPKNKPSSSKRVPTVSQARITRSTQFSSFVFCLAIARSVVLCGPALNGFSDINQCHELSRVILYFKSRLIILLLLSLVVNKNVS